MNDEQLNAWYENMRANEAENARINAAVDRVLDVCTAIEVLFPEIEMRYE